jgi:hypothetical protein
MSSMDKKDRIHVEREAGKKGSYLGHAMSSRGRLGEGGRRAGAKCP